MRERDMNLTLVTSSNTSHNRGRHEGTGVSWAKYFSKTSPFLQHFLKSSVTWSIFFNVWISTYFCAKRLFVSQSSAIYCLLIKKLSATQFNGVSVSSDVNKRKNS
jgi:hypothetical protein